MRIRCTRRRVRVPKLIWRSRPKDGITQRFNAWLGSKLAIIGEQPFAGR